MDAREDSLAVLEVVERYQRAAPDQVGEEVLAGEVGGDAARYDHPGPAGGGDRVAHQLGENRVGVHVTAASQRVSTTVAEQGTDTEGLTYRRLECVVENRIIVLQGYDQLLPRGLCWRGGDIGVTSREPLLLLEFDLLPGRVPNHHIETASRMNVGERDVRVQELVLVGERHDVIPGVGWEVAVLGDDPYRAVGDRGMVGCLGCDERSAPSVGGELGPCIGG